MLANVGKNAQTEKFWEHEMFETCCGNLFFYWNDPPMQKKSIILGHATLRRRKNPLFWDLQPCSAEKIHYFGTCNSAAQKKSIIFGHATLQRRKNPLFWDMQPCGAEKIHYFGTCNPAAQKKAIGFWTCNPPFAEIPGYFLTHTPAAPSQKRISTAIKHAQRQGEG